MTNHWIDIKNADVVLVMGSNPASNHPISMKWVMKAKEKGAKLIVVDPRFTQTAAKADVYAAMRSGTDIAFLGGMIKYIIDNNLIFSEYVVKYTNAPFLLNPDFKGPGDLNGLFSGYDEKTRKYDKKTWSFQMDENGVPKKDPTLKDPNSVYQQMKKHYSRYTLDKVSSITGTPKEKLVEVYKLYASTGKPNRVGTELYAMGWTQHTIGTQNIRAMTIVQLMLGNMGMAGGGINALRGESNVQGSTDHGLLFNVLPGYLPTTSGSIPTLPAYIEKYTPKTKEPKSVNWWATRGKYITSDLKAGRGDGARPSARWSARTHLRPNVPASALRRRPGAVRVSNHGRPKVDGRVVGLGDRRGWCLKRSGSRVAAASPGDRRRAVGRWPSRRRRQPRGRAPPARTSGAAGTTAPGA